MLPRLLFSLAVAISGGLALLVIASPALQQWVPQNSGWFRLLTVFAQDPTVRRTASAGAIGLVVTACVFFRRPGLSGDADPKQRKIPPSQDVAGA